MKTLYSKIINFDLPTFHFYTPQLPYKQGLKIIHYVTPVTKIGFHKLKSTSVRFHYKSQHRRVVCSTSFISVVPGLLIFTLN